jgi:hypothetical protein
MTLHVYYRETDGEIFGWSTSHVASAPPGLAFAELDDLVEPDPLTQRYDAAAGAMVDKTQAEIKQARRPSLRDVQVAVYRELVRTDVFMVSDYPLPPPVRHAWQAYRQMLRDLSNRDGPAAMIADWTLPPDGNDPIMDLRERFEP